MTDKHFENIEGAQSYQWGSNTLLVWFGGINEPFFSRNFAYESRFDCIYFVDLNYDWYTNGLSAGQIDHDQFVEMLTSICEKYDHVCFAGQSSGGYAALYYAQKCGASMVLAFSPQTRNLFDGQCGMTPKTKLVNIYELYAKADKTPNVVLNISRSEKDHQHEFQWRDKEQIAELGTLDNITVVTHPYDNHAVSVMLRHDDRLYRYVAAMIKVYTLAPM